MRRIGVTATFRWFEVPTGLLSSITEVAAYLGLKAKVHLLLSVICWNLLIIVRLLLFLKLKVQLILILSSDWLRYLTLFTSTYHHLMKISLVQGFLWVHLPGSLLPAWHLAFCLFIVRFLLLMKQVEFVVLLVHSDWHEALVKISRKLIVFLHNPYLIEQKILT